MSDDQVQPSTEYRKVFFMLCKELYLEEYQRVETINQRAVNLISLFSAILGVLYVISSLNYAPENCQYLQVLFYVGLGVSWFSSISGIICLFFTIFPRGVRNMATLDKWSEWIKEQAGQSQPSCVIETGLYTHASEQLANGQAARYRSNEKRFGWLKWSQVWLAVTLSALLVSVVCQFASYVTTASEKDMAHTETSTPPSPPPPPPQEETVKTADGEKK